jgi:hypothetical protein
MYHAYEFQSHAKNRNKQEITERRRDAKLKEKLRELRKEEQDKVTIPF